MTDRSVYYRLTEAGWSKHIIPHISKPWPDSRYDGNARAIQGRGPMGCLEPSGQARASLSGWRASPDQTSVLEAMPSAIQGAAGVNTISRFGIYDAKADD